LGWHPTLNPYPGADSRKDVSEFYQIKNKTGSAKGSDGEKLGRQFLQLAEHYPGCQRFYVSLVGRTLRGHRSMGAFLRKDPDAEVLVGLATFQQLGVHRDTPDIVLEMYLDAFETVLEACDYNFDEIVVSIAQQWIEKHGSEDPAYAMLYDAIVSDHADEQSSRTYGTKHA
jgi:hypothetical protein